MRCIPDRSRIGNIRTLNVTPGSCQIVARYSEVLARFWRTQGSASIFAGSLNHAVPRASVLNDSRGGAVHAEKEVPRHLLRVSASPRDASRSFQRQLDMNFRCASFPRRRSGMPAVRMRVACARCVSVRARCDLPVRTVIRSVHPVICSCNAVIRPVHAVICPVHGVICPVHGVIRPVHAVICPVHAVICPVHAVICPVHAVICPVHAVIGPVYAVIGACTLFSWPCTPFSGRCTPFSSPCTPFSCPCTPFSRWLAGRPEES